MEGYSQRISNSAFILQQLLPDWQKAVMKNKKAARLGCFLNQKAIRVNSD